MKTHTVTVVLRSVLGLIFVVGPLEHRIIHKAGAIRWVKSMLVARRDDPTNFAAVA